jgi:uracil-DNA glycosylase
MEREFTSLNRLEEEIRSCRKCGGILSKFGIVPRPIFGGASGFPIMLIGQAPGPTEYERNAPFQGDAGMAIRSLFNDCGLSDFDGFAFKTSVTKSLPGRRQNSVSDRKPGAQAVKKFSGLPCASARSAAAETHRLPRRTCMEGLCLHSRTGGTRTLAAGVCHA